MPRFHRLLGQQRGVKTTSEKQASWLGGIPGLEFTLQTRAVCRWTSLKDMEKKKIWQQATYWLSFFHCFLPNLSYPKSQASSPARCISDGFWHLFYPSPPLSIGPSCPDPWKTHLLSTKPHFPITTLNTHTHMHILCFFFFISPLNSLNSRNLSLAIFLIHLFDNFVQPKSTHLEQKPCAKYFKSNL